MPLLALEKLFCITNSFNCFGLLYPDVSKKLRMLFSKSNCMVRRGWFNKRLIRSRLHIKSILIIMVVEILSIQFFYEPVLITFPYNVAFPSCTCCLFPSFAADYSVGITVQFLRFDVCKGSIIAGVVQQHWTVRYGQTATFNGPTRYQ